MMTSSGESVFITRKVKDHEIDIYMDNTADPGRRIATLINVLNKFEGGPKFNRKGTSKVVKDGLKVAIEDAKM